MALLKNLQEQVVARVVLLLFDVWCDVVPLLYFARDFA